MTNLQTNSKRNIQNKKAKNQTTAYILFGSHEYNKYQELFKYFQNMYIFKQNCVSSLNQILNDDLDDCHFFHSKLDKR